MENTLQTDNLEDYACLKNIKFIAVQFENGLPEDWIATANLYGVRNSEIIDGTAWHHFSNKKQVFALTSNFQGLITPFGRLEIYTLDLPSDITFAEVTDAVSDLMIYDETLPT